MKEEDDELLFQSPSDWEKHWEEAGMPEYFQEDLEPWQSITIHFKDLHDREEFQRLLGFPVRSHNTLAMKWTWYPLQEYQKWTDKKAPPSQVPANKYPIYVISKGRYDTMLTARQLEHLGIPYHLVVEPQEEKKYAKAMEGYTCGTLMTLPEPNYGKGCSIPARNFCWEHSIKFWKAKRHWILDDNIQGFFEFNHNKKPKIRDYNPFSVVEKFTDFYPNIGLSGMNYEFFTQRRSVMPPYYLNTRVYSCILIRNDLWPEFKWRGKYNEDTDLSLRVLKAGFPTVLFNYVLAKKVTTGIMKGGNEAIYKLAGEDGRLKMAQSLKEQHPDLVTITHKWGRWQHHCDYRPFAKLKLERKNPRYGKHV